MKEQSILAWHFISSDRKLRYDSQELTVEPGYIYGVPDGPLIMCERGVHASRKPLDALGYAPGPVVCRVRCWGEIREDGDKLVCRNRQVLWLADAERALHEFAVWCVRSTPLKNGKTVWDLLSDPRSRRAVKVKESWLAGKATDGDLSAAGSAALSAARSAAGSAAGSAALSAAWSAAWSAAGSAAGSAALSAQNKQLEKTLYGGRG
jgi:hypothetical protein